MKAFFFDSIYNTQEFALEELNSEPILVISFHQEKGKGTSNRNWLNADQSLACSLAFNKEDNKLDETLIPLLSGLCFTEVLSESLNNIAPKCYIVNIFFNCPALRNRRLASPAQ